MKISEVIERLKKIELKHGDIVVLVASHYNGNTPIEHVYSALKYPCETPYAGVQ